MTEVGYFISGDNKLSYSYVNPPGKAKKAGFVFVHAAGGNRLGPHRMFVEMANNFNYMGYPTFRFDLRGCGDSTGNVSWDNIIPDVLDVVEATNFFVKRANLARVILFGISRGSYVCFTAMARYCLPLSGMILLSAPASSYRAALKSSGVRLKQYICKLRNPVYLWKLLSGRVNIYQIWQTLKTALQFNSRYARIEEKVYASGCPILFIYGERDTIGKESSRYYISKCQKHNLSYHCQFIEDANHSFFHYKWKEKIFSLSKQWLQLTLN